MGDSGHYATGVFVETHVDIQGLIDLLEISELFNVLFRRLGVFFLCPQNG